MQRISPASRAGGIRTRDLLTPSYPRLNDVLTPTVGMIPASGSRPVRRAAYRGKQPSTRLNSGLNVVRAGRWAGGIAPPSRPGPVPASEGNAPADVRLDGDEMIADPTT
jgi:hypothetical protein